MPGLNYQIVLKKFCTVFDFICSKNHFRFCGRVYFKLSKALQAARQKRLCSIDFVHPAACDNYRLAMGLTCDVF